MRSAAPSLAIIWFCSHAIAQTPFALDTSFRATFNDWAVTSVLALDDGDLIISGQIKFPGDIYFRSGARLNPDGSRDTNFPEVAYMGGRLTRWNDRIYSQNGQIVRRQLLDGTLDPEFIMLNDGPYFLSLQGGDYHVYPDGSVLVSGVHQVEYPDSNWVGFYNLIWFTADGYLDTTRAPRMGDGHIAALEQLPGGGFICSGAMSQYEGHPTSYVFRTYADGRLDTTFYTGVDWGIPYNFLPLADGRCYAAGRFKLENTTDTLFLVRFLPDGQLDPTFNNHLRFGITDELTNPWGLGGLSSLTWLDEGRLVLTGQFTDVDGAARGGICVVDTNGVLLDDHFVGAACGPHTYQNDTYALISGILFTDDDRCYIWGDYHGYTDGTTSDPQQRFVTRLYGPDIGMGVPTATAPTLQFYPNPASTALTLRLEALPANAELVLRDALGRTVLRQRIAAQYTTVPVHELPSGCYSAELLAHGQRTARHTVVVQR